MRSKLGIFSLFICSFFAACAMQTVESQKMTEKPPSEITGSKTNAVLVELFTSEG